MRRACVRSLELTQQHGARSIAFPAISTGIYDYPQWLAAVIGVAAVPATLPRAPSIRHVVYACCGDDSRRAHGVALLQAVQNHPDSR